MAQPGMTSARGEDWLVRKVQDLERAVQQLAGANVFGLTGITPEDGGTSFDGYVHVNGPMTVTGTLTLPAGVIGNDALSSPIAAQVVNTGAIGFGLSPTFSEKVSSTVTVPAGFTRAQVIAYADMTAVNSTAAGEYCFVQVKINGTPPSYTGGTYTPAGQYMYCGSNFATTLTGLGASFTISASAAANNSTWAANPDSNVINLNASITFLR